MIYCSPASFFYIPHLPRIFFFEPHYLVLVYVCYNWFFYLITHCLVLLGGVIEAGLLAECGIMKKRLACWPYSQLGCWLAGYLTDKSYLCVNETCLRLSRVGSTGSQTQRISTVPPLQ